MHCCWCSLSMSDWVCGDHSAVTADILRMGVCVGGGDQEEKTRSFSPSYYCTTLNPLFRDGVIDMDHIAKVHLAVQMNYSTITNKPMFQCSACDTKAIASPLMSAEITEMNKSARTSACCQTPTAMFDLPGFGGGIYLLEALMWHA